jgi:hypothetical protein
MGADAASGTGSGIPAVHDLDLMAAGHNDRLNFGQKQTVTSNPRDRGESRRQLVGIQDRAQGDIEYDVALIGLEGSAAV